MVSLTTITVIGLTGLSALIGERLANLQHQEGSELKQLIWGTVFMALAGLLPLIGWFLLTPVLLMISFGAAVLAWRHRKQTDQIDEMYTQEMP